MKQGHIIYKISILLVFAFNFLLIDFGNIKLLLQNFFKEKLNIFFTILIILFFSRNFYSLQIFVSSILVLLLFLNFKSLKKNFKIKLIYYFSILSIFNYYFLSFFLVDYSSNSYFLNYDTISNLNSYELFKGINFHNISVLYLGIFLLKLKYFKNCLSEFRNIFIISILHDLLFILNLGYFSLIFFFLLIISFLFFIMKFKIRYFNTLFIFILIFFSLSFFITPIIISKILSIPIQTPFENINNLIELMRNNYFELGNKRILDLEKIKAVGNEFIPLQGLLNRIFFYWSVSLENYDFTILGTKNYNPFLYHSLFLEFLINYGLAGLALLYLYLYKLYFSINSYYSKIFFLLIVMLNTLDTFLFSHHYQLMLISWIFVGLLDEKKRS